MSKNVSLGDRIKENYENRSKTYLTRRTPCMIRLDGKAFHTFTKGFVKPFDERLMQTMQETTLELCKNIQGCVFGYTQSDEITLILVDYNDIDTSAWYDYSVQKICSVSASMCTLYFNKIFSKKVTDFISEHEHVTNEEKEYGELSKEVEKVLNSYKRALRVGAMFDSRCFNIPISEVTNAVLFRQEDAARNSIYSLGRAFFSHKELQGKNGSQIQDMLMEKYQINWNDLPIPQKRGTAVVKNDEGKWYIDYNMPVLKRLGRDYVDSRITFEEE